MSELLDKANQILAEKRAKILPENIKKGVQIFDIIGTLEQGGASTDVPVKLFDTIESMHADTTSKENDMAIVYRREVQNMNESSVINSVTFPKTVVLPNALTSGTYGYVRGDSWESEHMLTLSPSYFYVESEYMFETIVRYSSTDGITYTRDDSYPETYEFSEPVTFSGTWNDNFGYFIQCEGKAFDGLYQYTLAARKDLLRTILVNNLSFDTSTNTVTWNGKYGGPVFEYQKIAELKTRIDNERPLSIETNNSNRHYYFVVGEDNEPYICAIINQNGTNHNTTGGVGVLPFIDTDGKVIGTAYSGMSKQYRNEFMGI